jgi:hypothetical protein
MFFHLLLCLAGYVFPRGSDGKGYGNSSGMCWCVLVCELGLTFLFLVQRK